MTNHELIDIHQAARISGLLAATLYKLARQRRVRSFKVLGALRFDPADLSELIVERLSSREREVTDAPR